MNLFKIFINSAVRQVGRDGGKVISNRVYGDSHSTPHRIVKNENGSTEEYDSTNLEVKKEYLLWKWILASILCFIPLVSFIGIPYVLWRGYINIANKYITMKELYNDSVKTPDRRFSSGYRVDNVTRSRNIKVLKNESEIKYTKIKGVGYVILGLLGIGMVLYFYLTK